MINATGIRNEENLKFYGYNTHHRNNGNEEHAGIAIMVRKGIQYRMVDSANLDLLAIEIETARGPVVVATTYIPPRRALFPMQEILDIVRTNKPVYLIGDLNARHRAIGSNSTNDIGRALNILINRNLITYLGPEFTTWVHPMGTGKPDVVLGNKKAHLNISITQGPLTSSDHLPIIVKLSTKPIMIESKPTYRYKKANWNKFQDRLRAMAEEIDLNHNNINKEFIDRKIDQWQKCVQTARYSKKEKCFSTTPKRK